MPENHRSILSGGIAYEVNPVHRNGMPTKSQWAIPEAHEVDSFTNALANTWVGHGIGIGWGLHLVNGRAAYLGVAKDRVTNLLIARFVDGTRTQNWHGYPADHQANAQDVPDESILNAWMAAELIAPAKIRKLEKRQPCRL